MDIDGTSNFERIGGNTSSVISTACAKAAASSLNIPLYRFLNAKNQVILPFPLGNIIGGGAHSMGPAPDMQEHLVVAKGAKTFKQAVRLNLMVHEAVGGMLEKRDCGFVGGTDDENAWTANLNDFEALEIIEQACESISQQEGVELRMGLDLAADRFWDNQQQVYKYQREGAVRNTQEQIEYMGELIERFNLIYVEDVFNSNDYNSFAELNKKYGHRCLICADDVYATNVERTKEGIKLGSAGAMIIKPNQVGTISGAKETSELAKDNGVKIILSHRSGETPDDSIAHMAVAWNALMIKTGVKGGERLAKLNELMRIEEILGNNTMLSNFRFGVR